MVIACVCQITFLRRFPVDRLIASHLHGCCGCNNCYMPAIDCLQEWTVVFVANSWLRGFTCHCMCYWPTVSQWAMSTRCTTPSLTHHTHCHNHTSTPRSQLAFLEKAGFDGVVNAACIAVCGPVENEDRMCGEGSIIHAVVAPPRLIH